MPTPPNPNMPESDEEFLQLLEMYGTQAAMAQALGISQGSISQRRTKLLGKGRPTITVRKPTYPRAPEWGLGGPQLVEPSVSSGDEVVAGLFDLHWPHHERALLEATILALTDLQPDTVIIGGDAIDLSRLSRWEAKQRDRTPPGVLYGAVREDLAKWRAETLGRIRAACPNAVIRYLEGNHDERLRMWLMGDQSVDGVEMANEWMGLDQLDVIWHPRCGVKLRQHFLVRHGEILSTHAAKSEQEKTRCGGWIGHGHRRRSWYEEFPEIDEAYSTLMAPVMCRRDYDYGSGGAGLAPWPQGFLVGTFDVDDEFDYETEIARWWKGRLLFRGKRY